jgi:co-chaperonin GroES (HSP10)
MKIKGTLRPIRDNIIITDMNFDEQKTASGIVLPSDNGKAEGVKSRWGRVWAIGAEQKDVEVGEWILLEHGRWSRGFTYEDPDTGEEIIIRRADPTAILGVSKEAPNQVIYGAHSTVQHATVDPSTFASPSF